MQVKELLKLLLPLVLIPITLYAVLLFGHDAGNAIIGLAFLVSILKFANPKERRFIIILAFIAALAETGNVAIGFYKYANVTLVPLWIPLGWSVVGMYIFKNLQTLKKINNNVAYGLSAVFYFIIMYFAGLNQANVITSLFAVITIYVLTKSSKFPASLFLFTGIVGAIIETSGTMLKVWSYLDSLGNIVPAPLAYVAIGYSSLILVAAWISGIED